MFDKFMQDEEVNGALRATASAEPALRSKAITQFLSAISLPIREGVMDGDNTAGIFNTEVLPPGVSAEYPIDFVTPGTEGEFRAFTNPGKGRVPGLVVSGDKLTLADIGNTLRVEWDINYARNARWGIIQRITEVFMAGFVKKRNDDCWHTILAMLADRGVTVYDIAANQGQFSKQLFTLTKCSMARNSGGNSSSLKKGRLTDIYLSCEGIGEVLNWNLDQVPDSVRANLYSMSGGDTTVVDILGVRLHEMYELGEDQEYQSYYINRLGGDLVPSGGGHGHNDVELAVALDLVNRDSFVMAYTQALEIFDDPTLHAQQKGGFYGWERYAIGCLDSRRGLPISY